MESRRDETRLTVSRPKRPFFASIYRELLADYALPIAVIAMSFFGSYVFEDVYGE